MSAILGSSSTTRTCFCRCVRYADDPVERLPDLFGIERLEQVRRCTQAEPSAFLSTMVSRMTGIFAVAGSSFRSCRTCQPSAPGMTISSKDRLRLLFPGDAQAIQPIARAGDLEFLRD